MSSSGTYPTANTLKMGFNAAPCSKRRSRKGQMPLLVPHIPMSAHMDSGVWMRTVGSHLPLGRQRWGPWAGQRVGEGHQDQMCPVCGMVPLKQVPGSEDSLAALLPTAQGDSRELPKEMRLPRQWGYAVSTSEQLTRDISRLTGCSSPELL